MPEDVLTEDQPLTEAELLDSPLIEVGDVGLLEGSARVVIPKRGKLFEEDGTCRVSVIRPCVSRGKRLRGLPPIYTPQMLAENAAVFSGWLMYMDHLTEAIVEALRKRGRSIRELGGRVVETYFDPTLTFKDDADYGYQPGGVVGKVLPQPPVRAMLEADPEILNVSINAYPRAAKPGPAPWNPSVRGMIVEGIRRVPQGSVDWVPRGGAGGRVLQEFEAAAVSILESYYDAAAEREDEMPNLKDMTLDKLRESLREENPELAKQLGIAEAADPAPPAVTPPAEGFVAKADVERMLAEQATRFEGQISTLRESTEDELDTRLSEERQASRLEELAHEQINGAGLPKRWTADLTRRYSVLPSGASPALLLEADTEEGKTVEEVLAARVEADIKHARDLIAEAAGRPSVKRLGGGTQAETVPKEKRNTAFRDFLSESGGLPERKEDGSALSEEEKDELIKDMVREGVS